MKPKTLWKQVTVLPLAGGSELSSEEYAGFGSPTPMNRAGPSRGVTILNRFLACVCAAFFFPVVPVLAQDTTAPVLRELSFSPASIDTTTGSQTVTVTVRITDDLAGLYSGAVWFGSPSQAQSRSAGFGSYNRISGDKFNGVYQSTLSFPQFGEAGIWHVGYVYTQDEVSNYKYVYESDLTTQGFPTGLTVASVQDTTAPVLRELSFSPASIDTTTGSQTVTVTVRITDDLAGLYSGAVWFGSPSQAQSRSAGFGSYNRISGDKFNGVYQSTLSFPQFGEAGIWHVGYVYTQDEVSNYKYVYESDLTTQGFPTGLTVASVQDTTAPVLRELSFSPASIDTTTGSQTVTVTVRITDDLAGLYSGAVWFGSPSQAQSRSAGFGSYNRISGDKFNGVYQSTLSFPQFGEAGIWHVGYVYTQDEVSNYKYVYESDLTTQGFPTELRVNEPNRAPVANGQSVVAPCSTPASITLTATDPDLDSLTFAVVTGPTYGTLSGTAPNLTYTATPGYTGPDSFTFRATDPLGASSLGTVTIQVGTHPDTPSFNYPHFVYFDYLHFSNAAQPIVDGQIRLTSAASQNGSVIYDGKLSMAQGFNSTFTFKITSPAGALDSAGQPGGDGLALVIQSQGASATGPRVGYIPYSITNAVAIELDTWMNGNLGDPNGNHISIQDVGPSPNGVDEFSQSHSLGSGTPAVNLSDGQIHTVYVQYRPGSLQVFLDGDTTPVASAAVDLMNIGGRRALDACGQGWLSLVAGTGAAYETHEIFTWSFDSLTPWENRPPTADPWGPYNIVTQEPLVLNASGSSDPDRIDHIALYEWDFDGAGTFATSSANPRLVLSAAQLTALGVTSGTHTLTLRVTDSNGATSTADTTVTVHGPAGYLKREIFTDLPGYQVSDLVGSSKFPDLPDWVDAIDTFESMHLGDNYGQRVSGYIIPPATGDYVFYLAADDGAQLWLSTDYNPAGKELIVLEPEWNLERNWLGMYAPWDPSIFRPGRQSAPIHLQAGNYYYIEALQKQAAGGDHVSVAWQLPGGSPPPNGSDPIVGQYLAYRVVVSAQTITFAPLPNRTYGDAPFTVSATASSGLPVTFTSLTPGVVSVGGSTVTILGAGTATIRASQSGNGTYAAAQPIDQTFTVSKGTPTISWSAPAPIQHGTALSAAQLNATANVPGTFTYTPPSGTVLGVGTNTLSVTFSPNNSANYFSATGTVSISVVNNPPVAADDQYQTAENTPLTIVSPGVLANDSDPDEGPMVRFTFEGRIVTGDSDFNANEGFKGFYDIDPAADRFDESDSTLTYQYRSSNVGWEIVFPDHGYRFAADSAYTWVMVGNDKPVLGDRYVAYVTGGSSVGTPLASGRVFTGAQLDLWDPVSDGADLLTDETLQVTSINLAAASSPGGRLIAGSYQPQIVVTKLTGPLTIIEVNGQAAAVNSVVTLASGAKLRVNGNGSFSYDPTTRSSRVGSGATAVEMFTYKVQDREGAVATAMATITVTSFNNPPVATPQTLTTAGDTGLAVTLAGSDGDQDALSYTILSRPNHGILTGTAPNLTYTPNYGYNGPDSFTFKVNDGKVDSSVASVAITVTPVNHAPTAVPLALQTLEDTALNINLYGFDLEESGYAQLKVMSGLDGERPAGRLVLGMDGMIYGTASSGGSNNLGTVFRMNPDGSGFTVLHDFTTSASDGRQSYSGLIQDPQGVLYGTTYGGGTYFQGTLFKINPDGTGFAIIHHFQPPTDGYNPQSRLFLGSDGLIYGTTFVGCTNSVGSVYRVERTGANFTVLHAFGSGGQDGRYGSAGVTMGSDGFLYGTTRYSVTGFGGTVYRLRPDGSNFQVLRSFPDDGSEGRQLLSCVVEGPDGVLYGMAWQGGDNDFGVIYQLNRDGSGFSVLHRFGGIGDGLRPYADLLRGSDGWLYGTTAQDSIRNGGIVFRMQPGSQALQVLYSFQGSGANGRILDSPLTEGPGGVLYGMTSLGGPTDTGTIFKLSMQPAALQTTVVSGPAKGTLSGTPPNLVYTPNMKFNGSDSFTFKVNDGTLDSAPTTVFITVTPVNNPPLANAGGPYSITQGNNLALDASASTDPDTVNGDSIVSYSWDLNGDGTFGDASSSSPTLTLTSAQVSGLGLGTRTIAVRVTDSTGATGTASTTLSIRATQTITFNPLPNRTYGDAAFTLSASASSGLAVTLTSLTPSVATVSGNTVTIVGPGTATIRASQAGNGNYLAAANVDQTFTVAQAGQTITFAPIPGHTYGEAPFTLTGSASSGLPVTLTSLSPSVATVSGNTVTILGAGSVTIRASQPGGGNYIAAANVDQILTIAKASQTITFNPPTTSTYGADVTLDGGASSGLPVNYTFSGPATFNGTLLHFTGLGTVTVTAAQAGNANYNPAASVARSISVDKAALTVHADTKSKVYGQANPALTVTYSGFVNGDTASVLKGAPKLTTTGGLYGTYPITVTLGNLTAANYSFVLANGVMFVTRANTTVSVANVAGKFGAASTTLSASVTAVSPSTAAVNEGSASFTLSTSAGVSVGQTVTATVSKGTGTVSFSTGSLARGTYTVSVIYTDTLLLAPDFYGSSSTAPGTLTIK